MVRKKQPPPSLSPPKKGKHTLFNSEKLQMLFVATERNLTCISESSGRLVDKLETSPSTIESNQ